MQSEDGVVEKGNYVVFSEMEQLSEKLKRLNYESDFIRKLKQKPISRHYFAIATNPGEQFHSFVMLSHWIVTKSGKQMEMPQEYDDPNAIIASILEHAKTSNPALDVIPSRLKAGYGLDVIAVLSSLANSLLSHLKLSLSSPKYIDESKTNTQDITDISVTAARGPSEWSATASANPCTARPASDMTFNSEELCAADEDNDDGFLKQMRESLTMQIMQASTDLRPASDTPDGTHVLPDSLITDDKEKNKKPNAILHSSKDSAQWIFEVERVLPQLKVTLHTDSKDWRMHLDQMRKHKDEITQQFEAARQQLSGMHDEIQRSMGKIESREKYLNSQLEGDMSQFRVSQDRLEEAQNNYKSKSDCVAELSRVLADKTDELERVKLEMEERGSSMTDGSPVIKIKQAMQRIKSEIVHIDIRIGVLEHILLRLQTGQTRFNLSESFFANQLETDSFGLVS